MAGYEYRMVRAPARPIRMKGLARGEDAVCAGLTQIVNDEALAGWEYLRTDVVAVVTGRWPFRHKNEVQVFVFRRLVSSGLLPALPAPDRALLPSPAITTVPVPAVRAEPPKRPLQWPPVPRTVRNPEAVERVKTGARRIVPASHGTPAHAAE